MFKAIIRFLFVMLLLAGVMCAQMAENPTAAAGQDKTIRTGLEMVSIRGGCYTMGDQFGDGARDERPTHEVCVKDFSLGKYEVTRGLWKEVMGEEAMENPFCAEAMCPAEGVSWDDAQVFLKKLEARDHKHYRLPTEAEWEYAAREGGRREKWAGTNSDHELSKMAWLLSNSDYKIHVVGQKWPNHIRLFDMTGNAWEWTSDWYDAQYYANSPKDNPQGPATGAKRALRGGFWGEVPTYAANSRRIGLSPKVRALGFGFRLAHSAE